MVQETGVQSYQRLKTKGKMEVLDASLLKTQHYKEQIKGKRSNPGKAVALSLHLNVVAIEKVDYNPVRYKM